MTKIIYGGLLKNRINLSREENKYNLINSERTLRANAIEKTKTKRREATPIIYGDLYKKRIAETEKEDIFRKRLEEMAYSIREGRRRVEQPQREGVIMPGQVANRTPPISAITKEMIDEYHEAEKLKPLIIDGEIRKYEKALYEPNLTFDEELQSTKTLEDHKKYFEGEREIHSILMGDIDNEIITTNENIQRIKNDINEKGFTGQKNILLKREELKLGKLKDDYKTLENKMDKINYDIKKTNEDFDKIKKHNSEVNSRNREEVLKYEQSLNLINRNRLNLQQQPNESEYEYYNRLREIERTKYDPVLYKQYAENEQTKTLKTHLNSLFADTTFKEEILSNLTPEDKFIINKHFDEIETQFLSLAGYDNRSLSPKMVAKFFTELSNEYKRVDRNEERDRLLQVNRGIAQERARNKERERLLEVNKGIAKERAKQRLQRQERQEQINEREQRISERVARREPLRQEREELERLLNERSQTRQATKAERERMYEADYEEQLQRAEERRQQREAELERLALAEQEARTVGERKAIEKARKLKEKRIQAEEEAIRKRVEANKTRIQERQQQNEILNQLEQQQQQQQQEEKRILQEQIEVNKEIKKLEKKRRDSDLSEADTIALEDLKRRRSDFGKRRMPYRTYKNYKAAKVIEDAYVNRLARQEMKRLKTIKEAKGEGLRGRIHPKKRVVKVSKKDLLRNRLFLIASEIKAGNDNPKLIIEMNKLYKELYGIDNAYLHFKK